MVSSALGWQAKAVDAIGAQAAAEFFLEPQHVQMGYRLAHGEGHLVQIQRAGEQNRHHITRALRTGGSGLHHFGQAIAVVGVQLLDAHMQASKRLAVRR